MEVHQEQLNLEAHVQIVHGLFFFFDQNINLISNIKKKKTNKIFLILRLYKKLTLYKRKLIGCKIKI